MVEYGKDIEYEPDGTILCRHPTKSHIYAYVKPSKIEPLLLSVDINNNMGESNEEYISSDMLTIPYAKNRCKNNSLIIREDHLRHLNPTPMKISLDKNLYEKSQRIIISKKQHTIIS